MAIFSRKDFNLCIRPQCNKGEWLARTIDRLRMAGAECINQASDCSPSCIRDWCIRIYVPDTCAEDVAKVLRGQFDVAIVWIEPVLAHKMQLDAMQCWGVRLDYGAGEPLRWRFETKEEAQSKMRRMTAAIAESMTAEPAAPFVYVDDALGQRHAIATGRIREVSEYSFTRKFDYSDGRDCSPRIGELK